MEIAFKVLYLKECRPLTCEKIMFTKGQAVLVCNDFSTPEQWEFPAFVVGPITEDDPNDNMLWVDPFDRILSGLEEGEMTPVFVNSCYPLTAGTVNGKPAYLNPETNKLYYQGELEKDFFIIDESEEVRPANSLIWIGEIEDQTEE